jgi:hypothetical protein
MALSKLDSTALGTLSGNISFASGQGIDFSATSDSTGTNSSELFDDYEEGTFTPTLFGASTAGSITYVRQAGFYRKIGKICFYVIRFQWSAFSGASGSIKIGNMPFTSRAQSDSTFDVTTDILTHGVDIPSDAVDIPAFYTAQNNTELVALYTKDTAAWAGWVASSFHTSGGVNKYMSLSGSYFTD